MSNKEGGDSVVVAVDGSTQAGNALDCEYHLQMPSTDPCECCVNSDPAGSIDSSMQFSRDNVLLCLL